MATLKKLSISSIAVLAFLAFAGNAYAITLSQTNLSMTVGQTYVVTANNIYNYYNNYGTIYISNNSNSSVASASVNGNNISIYANNSGSTSITVCQNNSGSSCASIYVSVSGGYYNNNNSYYNNNSNTLGLSISNLVFAVGSDVTLSSANYAGLYISNNSNPSVASALNASTTSGTSGCTGTSQYSTLTGQPCGNLVNNGGYYSSSSIPGCYAGAQYSTLTGQPCFNNYNNQVNNYNYNYGNTNNSSVEILGVSTGTDTITLCQSNNGSACTTINVTVY
jgi:hypothetical protein